MVADALDPRAAESYAECFACLAEPTRVRLLHTVASADRPVTVGELTTWLGISQSTASHHVRKLADVGFVRLCRRGTSTLVSVNPSCVAFLPHAADAVMGLVSGRPCRPAELPIDVSVRALRDGDRAGVQRLVDDAAAAGDATFETANRHELDAAWLPGHRWVAEIDGTVGGWTAAAPVSTDTAYAGVAETSTYVGAGHRRRGVGTALLRRQVAAADAAGLWTLQAVVFPEDRAGLALHRGAGFRTVGVRERIAHHQGAWRDTVLLERRSR